MSGVNISRSDDGSPRQELQMVHLAADQVCFNSCTSSCGEADLWTSIF